MKKRRKGSNAMDINKKIREKILLTRRSGGSVSDDSVRGGCHGWQTVNNGVSINDSFQ